MCFAEEFCVRWSLNAYDSRYGIFLKDKFDIKSAQYSYVSSLLLMGRAMVVLQSLWCAIEHMLLYPWMVEKLDIPIPYMAVMGHVIMFFCYIGMSASKTMMGSIIWCFILWVGYGSASPASVSILSVFALSVD